MYCKKKKKQKQKEKENNSTNHHKLMQNPTNTAYLHFIKLLFLNQKTQRTFADAPCLKIDSDSELDLSFEVQIRTCTK